MKTLSDLTKKLLRLSISISLCLSLSLSLAQVGVGTTTPHASAALEVNSTTQGMLVPRLTTSQRTTISNAATGLLVYDSNTNSFWFKNATAWIELIDSTNNLVQQNGANIYMAVSGNVGIGTSTPSQKLHISGITYISDKLGIANSAPNAPLQFANAAVNRKIVLWESANNDHQFYGLGINGNTMRYQVGGTSDRHVFYAGTSSSASNELMRISGNGNVGIGVISPGATLSIARGTGSEGTMHILGTTHPSHFNYSTAENTYIRGGKAGSHVLLNDISGLGNVGIGTNAPPHKLSVTGNTGITGNLAIGNGTAANAPLQFANGNQNRKIVLHEAANNDNQFFGFGINGGTMRYQVNNPADHVFYAGNTDTESVELMRIKGDGKVGIGLVDPLATLTIARGTAFEGALKVHGTTYASHYHYSTNENTYIRGGKNGSHILLNDIAGLGNVGIGTDAPVHKLSIAGNTGINGNLAIGNGTAANAPLQFQNTTANRKIVLYEGQNNDHQFTGFGYSNDEVRYQVQDTIGDHVFYAGKPAGTSKELMRIDGNGNMAVKGNLAVVGSIHAGYQMVWQTFMITANQTAIMTVNCPSGYRALTCGWESWGESFAIRGSAPENFGTTWSMKVKNFHNADLQFAICVLCARIGD